MACSHWFASSRWFAGIELAKKNIEGELTIDEVRELIKKHYEEKQKIRRMDYETYTRIDVHPDSEGAKMGRPI